MQYRLEEPALHNTRGRLFACVLCLLLNVAACPARADINLLAPGRTIDPMQPLRLSLLVTGEADSRDYILPAVLVVSLTPDLGAAATVELHRATSVPDQITLRAGEFMRIDYVGTVPTRLRGRVRIDAVDIGGTGHAGSNLHAGNQTGTRGVADRQRRKRGAKRFACTACVRPRHDPARARRR